MKITLYKAKHFWKEEESATWLKSDKFDHRAFTELKRQYEKIKYSRVNHLIIDDKTLFLFYQSKKDFHDRPITEITALQTNKKFNDIEKAHQNINNQIINIFDNKLDYEIEIVDDLIAKNINPKIYIISLVFALLIIVYFTFEQDEKLAINAAVPIQKDKPEIREIPIPDTLTWKWYGFCGEYNVLNPRYCYEEFIKQKCINKESFLDSYLEFIQKGNNAICIDLKDIDNLKSDNDLLDKKFRSSEMKFFSEEKQHEQ